MFEGEYLWVDFYDWMFCGRAFEVYISRFTMAMVHYVAYAAYVAKIKTKRPARAKDRPVRAGAAQPYKWSNDAEIWSQDASRCHL